MYIVQPLIRKHFAFAANYNICNVNITISIEYALTLSTKTLIQKRAVLF